MSRKEQLLQVGIPVVMLFGSAGCVLVCLSDPFNTRYFAWLADELIPREPVPSWSWTWLRLLLASLSLVHYCVIATMVVSVLLLVPICFIIYTHKTALWLKYIRDMPPCPVSSEVVLNSYRRMQVLHSLWLSLIRPQLLPLGMLVTYVFSIQFNFMFIVHNKNTPLPSAILYVEGALCGLMLLVCAGQLAASIHIFSGQVNRRWSKYAKETGNEYLEARLRGCAPLSMEVGPFFKMTKTTAYKMVLFLVLNTFKAVLMFREKKRG